MAYVGQRERFEPLYRRLATSDVRAYTVPFWERANSELERKFLPYPPFDFLNEAILLETVVANGSYIREEIQLLERRFPNDRLKVLLREDLIGDPVLHDRRYLTSHNRVHHLYHIARFLDRTGAAIQSLRTIVEWGAGYGDLARLFLRLRPAPLTYVCIDTPLFVSIQYLYLSTILGIDRVHVVLRHDDIKGGKVNLLSVGLIDWLQLRADLFVSTWALSESSVFAQDDVVRRNWFGAPRLLLAYQIGSRDFPTGGRLGELAQSSGAALEEISFIQGSRYAFR